MATLTTSWVSYASTSWTGSSGAKVTFYLEAKYSTQSVANNTTTIYTRLRSEIKSGSISGSGYKFTCSYCEKKEGSGVWTFKDETIISSNATQITHNTDGTKNLTLNATAKNNYWNIDKSLSATVTLPKINRYATITVAPNFTDEDDPTILYSNPLGDEVTSLQACISLDGSKDDIVYRDVPKGGPGYTFELTEDERNILRQATTNSNTRNVKFFVQTTINGNVYRNNVQKTLTIINANPTLTLTKKENNSLVKNLLGSDNANTVIQNVSEITLLATPTTLKYATTSKVTFTRNNENVEILNSPYQTSFVATNGVFEAKITDSRGNVGQAQNNSTLIEYQVVSVPAFTAKRTNPTSSDIVFNATINYYQKTFGNTANNPTITWKVGENGTLNTLSAEDYQIDEQKNRITINTTKTNVLDYRLANTIYLYVNDLLSSSSNQSFVTKGIATFDAGERDFNVNGDLTVSDEDGNNPINVLEEIDNLKKLSTQNILWEGAYYMHGTQQIDLSENPISKQPNGIVLLFSAYENEAEQNYNWCSFFIPKTFCELHNGNGMLFPMFTTAFGTVGNKYIYIYNDMLKGHADNTKTGTGGSGITYKNNSWVLRYVIGI